MRNSIAVPRLTHPLLLEDTAENHELFRRQRVGLAVAGDAVADARERGHIGAESQAYAAVAAYEGYMQATDDAPAVAVPGDCDDEMITAVVGHFPDTEWGWYVDPVPALVAEILRLTALLDEAGHGVERERPRPEGPDGA